jgi:hypothetical protein
MSYISDARRVFGFTIGDLLWLSLGVTLAALIVLAATV